MRHHPGQNHDPYTDKPENHAERSLIIGSQYDVIHVSCKSGHGYQRDVHNQERDIAEQQNKVD